MGEVAMSDDNDPYDDELAAKAEAHIDDYIDRTPRPEDFVFDLPSEKFIDVKSGAMVAAATVNGVIPREFWRSFEDDEGEIVFVKPTIDIMNPEFGRLVYGRTWWPGMPQIIARYMCSDGELREAPNMKVFNEYLPPITVDADWEGDAGPYINHIEQLFPNEVERQMLLDRLAFKVQFPDRKLNGLCVIHGPQGSGKDTLFVPFQHWLGNSLMKTVKGSKAGGRFNAWVRSLLVVINETSSREQSSVELYEALKDVTVAPPLFIPVERKGIDEYEVANRVALFTTTNHPFSLHIEDDDRRLTMLHAARKAEEWPDGYFERFYAWMNGGGWKQAIFWLSRRDLHKFNPSAKAPTTESKEALRELVSNVRRTPLDDYLENYFEAQGAPDIFITSEFRAFIAEVAFDDAQMIDKLVFGKSFPHKMREHGYYGIGQVKVDNERFSGVYVTDKVIVKNQAAFAKSWLSRNRCGNMTVPADLSKWKKRAAPVLTANTRTENDEPF
jgi:Family of unknown function (DUF5906)